MAKVKRPYYFRTLPTGCFICVSHKPNADGYLRVRQSGQLWMFHRLLVLAIRGIEIPEGHEVDHLCNNLGCSNPSHLSVVDRTTHLVKTNKERYAPTKQAARAHWMDSRCTGTALAGRYGCSISSACLWIREFKSQAH